MFLCDNNPVFRRSEPLLLKILSGVTKTRTYMEISIYAGEDVRAALDGILSGRKLSEKAVPSTGCSIKWHP